MEHRTPQQRAAVSSQAQGERLSPARDETPHVSPPHADQELPAQHHPPDLTERVESLERAVFEFWQKLALQDHAAGSLKKKAGRIDDCLRRTQGKTDCIWNVVEGLPTGAPPVPDAAASPTPGTAASRSKMLEGTVPSDILEGDASPAPEAAASPPPETTTHPDPNIRYVSSAPNRPLRVLAHGLPAPERREPRRPEPAPRPVVQDQVRIGPLRKRTPSTPRTAASPAPETRPQAQPAAGKGPTQAVPAPARTEAPHASPCSTVTAIPRGPGLSRRSLASATAASLLLAAVCAWTLPRLLPPAEAERTASAVVPDRPSLPRRRTPIADLRAPLPILEDGADHALRLVYAYVPPGQEDSVLDMLDQTPGSAFGPEPRVDRLDEETYLVMFNDLRLGPGTRGPARFEANVEAGTIKLLKGAGTEKTYAAVGR